MDPVYINWTKFFVDFAHTPDGLEKTLSFASNAKWNWRLITICWAPWNRDKEKRPIMWEIAVRYSDIVIFTDDDPDTENRLSILNQLTKSIQEKWYPAKKKVFVVPERNYALKLATEIAKEWDIVVSCWKWHEQIQLTNFWKRKWNDKKQLISILQSQNKTILNTKEIKKSYLEKLKSAKSQPHITPQQYYANQNINNHATNQTNNQIWNTPSWMFKPSN